MSFAPRFSSTGRWSWPSRAPYRANLVQALSNLGAGLDWLRLSREAVSVQVEAVELYRTVEQAESGRQNEYLAWALHNLGSFLCSLGQDMDALPAQVEAVERFRAAEQNEPGRYRADLARALGGLGSTLSNFGLLREAESTFVEAMKLYRKMCARITASRSVARRRTSAANPGDPDRPRDHPARPRGPARGAGRDRPHRPQSWSKYIGSLPDRGIS